MNMRCGSMSTVRPVANSRVTNHHLWGLARTAANSSRVRNLIVLVGERALLLDRPPSHCLQ